MGKTKTSFVEGVSGKQKSGKATYEEKKRKQGEERKKREAEEKKKVVKGVGLKGGERVKVVEAGPIIEEGTEEISTEETKIQKRLKVHGSKYKIARAKVDKVKKYKIADAIKLVKNTSYSKFDGTVELNIVAKNDFSDKITLPFSTGKEKKVEVADENTIKKLTEGKIDFDILLATPEMMPKLVPFAKTLGPRGLMPNPKNGTLIKDAKEADKYSSKTLVVKTEKGQPIIHTIVGKVSQKENELEGNIEAIVSLVGKKQIVKAYLKATMGPSIKLQI